MNRRAFDSNETLFLLAAALTLLAITVTVPAPAAAQLDDEAVTRDNCNDCHSFNRVEAKGKSRFGWGLSVWRMEAVHGCDLGDGEREQVPDYLAENYPRRDGEPSRDLAEYFFAGTFLVLALIVVNLVLVYRRR